MSPYKLKDFKESSCRCLNNVFSFRLRAISCFVTFSAVIGFQFLVPFDAGSETTTTANTKRSPESVAASLARLSGSLLGGGSANETPTDNMPPPSGDTGSGHSPSMDNPSMPESSAIGEIKEALVLGSDAPVDAISPPAPESGAIPERMPARVANDAAMQANPPPVSAGIDSARSEPAKIDPIVEQLAISTKFDKARAAANDGNFTQARKIWEILAELDHADSQYSLGRMYARGDGVKQDFAKARAYFERAAAHNHARALYSLGVMARNGDGQLINQEKALSYFERSAAAGYDGAKVAIRELKR